MIPFSFAYYRPSTIEEAVGVFQKLSVEGKGPVYYGGGSELISMARVGNLSFGAVVDIKNIPECKTLGWEGGRFAFGSAVTLSEITESNCFPLLGKAAGRIADHTMQCRITLGGNLSSTIIYRETALPLLLAGAHLTAAGPDGFKEYDIRQVFQKKLTLPKGSFLVKASIQKEFLSLPYFHMKKTKNEKIDYPLMTAAGLKVGGAIRIAFSGLASYPFRSEEAEAVLNDRPQLFRTRGTDCPDFVPRSFNRFPRIRSLPKIRPEKRHFRCP